MFSFPQISVLVLGKVLAVPHFSHRDGIPACITQMIEAMGIVQFLAAAFVVCTGIRIQDWPFQPKLNHLGPEEYQLVRRVCLLVSSLLVQGSA
jgi:hypothetical protein